jgi:hypothetical protein
MLLERGLGLLSLGLSLYYLRFYVLRGDPVRLLQIVTLVCAGGLLLLSQPVEQPQRVWFRGWWPVSWQAWLIVLGALALAAVVFVVMDNGSHSASDTLNRSVPIDILLAAVVLKLRAEHHGSPSGHTTHPPPN